MFQGSSISIPDLAEICRDVFEKFDFVERVWLYMPGADLDFIVQVNKSVGLHFYDLHFELGKLFEEPVHLLTSAELNVCIPGFLEKHSLPLYKRSV